MATLSESKKRDFVDQIVSILELETSTLQEKGFDPTNRKDGLRDMKSEADTAETAQQDAAAKAMQATALSQEKLDIAYREASNIADLISGFLGKEDELVRKIRKFRK